MKHLPGPHLVVYHGEVKVADLLKCVCQVGVSLRHVGVQHDAAVIEGDALPVVAQLVVNGPNEKQHVGTVGRLCVVYLRMVPR